MFHKHWLYAILIFTILFAWVPVSTVRAQTTVNFTTTITYQNTGSSVAHVSILFYPEGVTTPISISRPDLAVGASATVSIGSLGGSAGFKGSAVVKSDVQLSVLMTQIPNTSSVKARPMATGFSSGTADLWFINIQNGTDKSVFSIQNIDSRNADLSLTFYGSSSPVVLKKTNIPAGGSVFFDLSKITELPTGSYNAVHVISNQSGSTAVGKIVGMHMLMAGNPANDTAIESLTQSAKTLYMPIAICQGTASISTSYFIFNPDPANSTSIKVAYNSGKSETRTLAALSGGWFHACMPSGTSAGYDGNATITSSTVAVMAQGLIKNGGVNTNFYGQAVGSSRLAVPYANYSASQYTTQTRQRTSISIVNMGGSLASNTVSVQYYDKNGRLVGTHKLGAIGSGGRATSSPASIGSAGNEFGYYSDGTTGGSAIIVGPAGSNLMATVWVSSMTGSKTYTGEVYNAISAVTN